MKSGQSDILNKNSTKFLSVRDWVWTESRQGPRPGWESAQLGKTRTKEREGGGQKFLDQIRDLPPLTFSGVDLIKYKSKTAVLFECPLIRAHRSINNLIGPSSKKYLETTNL